MGLLGNLLNSVISNKSGMKLDPNTVSSVLELLNNNKVGGLEGLVGKLAQGGLGNIVDSWVSTGKNKSVSSNQLSNVLGSDVVGQLASKLGMSNSAAAGTLAKVLPNIVDKLTPNGKIDSSSQSANIQDLLSKFL